MIGLKPITHYISQGIVNLFELNYDRIETKPPKTPQKRRKWFESNYDRIETEKEAWQKFYHLMFESNYDRIETDWKV